MVLELEQDLEYILGPRTESDTRPSSGTGTGPRTYSITGPRTESDTRPSSGTGTGPRTGPRTVPRTNSISGSIIGHVSSRYNK